MCGEKHRNYYTPVSRGNGENNMAEVKQDRQLEKEKSERFRKVFDEMKNYFSCAYEAAISGDFAYQFNIEGDGAGAFYVRHRDGAVQVEPYDYVDRTGEFIATADTYRKIAKGAISLEKALEDNLIRINGDADTAFTLWNSINKVRCHDLDYADTRAYRGTERRVNSEYDEYRRLRPQNIPTMSDSVQTAFARYRNYDS